MFLCSRGCIWWGWIPAWLTGAIAFEFGFGHYVDGLSWTRLLSDYDLSEGRLLVLLWLVVGAGPFLLARLRQRRARG